ncbi:class A beta-lactamase [Leifsonia virtsii]|uniref:Beta-lactamase n=1 Tax=Leifsonia virtsii TaxID=3035915 RepID=A0ABT8J029_9MICO|nr:class A beta-lactamase [Leifsonia virtsii]MDN4598436.1 class A beta-lactamase [Leifsonia virtsii]
MSLGRLRATTLLSVAVLALLTGCATARPVADHSRPLGSEPTSTADAGERAASRALADLEKQYDATLGVYAVDTGSGRSVAYRADERFAYASTSKALLAGALLASVDDGALDATVHYTSDDLVTYSPVTEAHVADGMPLRDVIAAALRSSDNTAANLMFRELGGPGELQKALRGLGDTTTVVARREPDLNEAAPGDERDTSTPRALADDLRSYAVGDTLTPERRRVLLDDLTGNATGAPLIRAGIPAEWTVADKSGAAAYGTRNDIAVVVQPGRAPVVMVVLSRKQAQDAAYDNALIADAARALATAFG